MKGAMKGDHMLAFGMIARQLEGRLDGLGAGIGEENFFAALAWRQAGELLGQLDHRFIIKIAAANMEKLARLLFNRFNHPWMGMTGVGHRNAGHEIEKQIAVDVFDHTAAPFLDHQRIDATVGRRGAFLIALDDRFGFGTGKRGFDVGNFHN